MRIRLATVVVAGLTAATAALAGCSSGSAMSPGSPGASAPSTLASSPAAPTAAGGSPAAATAPTGSATPTAAALAPSPVSLVPVWPFTTLAQVRAWQAAFRSGGHQPWHLDAAQTALGFARGQLGYTEIDRVTTTSVNGGDAHLGVGWSDPESSRHTVAVLHLIRFGSGSDAPWAVVGSDDTELTIDRPGYGRTVALPLTVGGLITGVDESLRVIVLGATSSSPLATSAGLPAGGTRTPWSTTLRFSAPSGSVLTIAVSTGGHLKKVERFAITAVRVA